jgi:hypothetical protein
MLFQMLQSVVSTGHLIKMSKLNNVAQRHRRDPDQAFGRKKPKAIYNADIRLPPRQPRLVRLGLSSRCAFRVLLFTLETSNKHSVCTPCTQFVTYTHKHGTCTLHCLSSCIRTTLLSPKSSKNETSTMPHEHSQCLSRVYRRSRT